VQITTLITSIIANLLAENLPSPLITIPLDLTIEVMGSECVPAIDIETIESDLAFANSRFISAGITFYIRNITTSDFSYPTDIGMITSVVNKFAQNNDPDRVELIYGYSAGFDQLIGITLAGQKVPNGPVYSSVKITSFYRDHTVLCHELGHTLLLGHSFDNEEGLKDIEVGPNFISDPIGFIDYCWLNRNIMNYGGWPDSYFTPNQIEYLKEKGKRFIQPDSLDLPGFP